MVLMRLQTRLAGNELPKREVDLLWTVVLWWWFMYGQLESAVRCRPGAAPAVKVLPGNKLVRRQWSDSERRLRVLCTE